MSVVKRVVLVQPKVNEKEPVYAPLALLFLAGYLEQHGYSVLIIDTRLSNDWQNQLKEELTGNQSPLLVGVTCMTGLQIHYALEVSKFVKQYSKSIPVVFGGVHPSFFPEQTLENDLVDFVLIKKGEKSLLSLCQYFENKATFNLNNLTGVGYKENGKIIVNQTEKEQNFDDFKIPWGLVDVNQYASKLSIKKGQKLIDIVTSRGCPFRCAFCYSQEFYGRKWQGRNINLVVDEIRLLRDEYGITHFLLHDDLVGFGKHGADRLLEIFFQVNNGDKKMVYFSTNLRVTQLTRPFVDRLVEKGLWQIRAGVESGSDRMLKAMAKDIFVGDIEKSAKTALDVGFDINYSFVIGWPGETPEDQKKTVALCLKLKAINPHCTIYPLWNYIPYPGTPFYDSSLKLGFVPPKKFEEWSKYGWGSAVTPWMNRHVMENMHTLSQVLFSSAANPKAVFLSCFDSDLKLKIKLRRIFGWVISLWAQFRFRKGFWFMPYEYKVLNPLFRRISS